MNAPLAPNPSLTPTAHTAKHRARSQSAQAWQRFKNHRRAIYSLILLIALYVFSLFSECISNDKPLLLKTQNRIFFPAFCRYSQDDFFQNGNQTQMLDYAAFLKNPPHPIQALVQTPFRSGVDQTFDPSEVLPYRHVTLRVRPITHVAAVQLSPQCTPIYTLGDASAFSNILASITLSLESNPAFQEAFQARLKNQQATAFELPFPQGTLALAPFTPRPSPPSSIRVFLRETEKFHPQQFTFHPEELPKILAQIPVLSHEHHTQIQQVLPALLAGEWIPPIPLSTPLDKHPNNPLQDLRNDPESQLQKHTNRIGEIHLSLEPLAWPFRPIPGHPMGFDAAGRDVFARLLYATRTSLTFGLALVFTTLLLGAIAGAIQGYFAGWIDILGQRFTEIWSALPFLYVMILLGNTLGRSFGLLLLCYAAFNWIGAAAYVRAEFLRLRSFAFVDAAQCQGLSASRIIFRHILPNALTPLITLLPFALVGAIGSLAVLDYLGFGLPAGSPSWGELLNQAQAFRQAWWLILFPSLALFFVMLLGVFIGEGLRDALDPRPYSKMS